MQNAILCHLNVIIQNCMLHHLHILYTVHDIKRRHWLGEEMYGIWGTWHKRITITTIITTLFVLWITEGSWKMLTRPDVWPTATTQSTLLTILTVVTASVHVYIHTYCRLVNCEAQCKWSHNYHWTIFKKQILLYSVSVAHSDTITYFNNEVNVKRINKMTF